MARAVCAFSRETTRISPAFGPPTGLVGLPLGPGPILLENSRQCATGLFRIDVAHRENHWPDSEHCPAMPGTNLRGGNAGKGLGQTSNRKPIGSVPKSSSESQLERIAEHVIGHLLGLDLHQVALGVDVSLGEAGSSADLVQQSCRFSQMLGQNIGAETEPVRGGCRTQSPAQPLEGERQACCIQISSPSHRAADHESCQPRALRRLELEPGHVESQRNQRNAGLAPNQEIHSLQSGVAHVSFPGATDAKGRGGDSYRLNRRGSGGA